jgi:hypothetical protein
MMNLRGVIMRITDITIERMFTLNLGNYESAKFSAAMTAHLDPDDNPDDAYAVLSDTVMGKLQADIDAFGSTED